MLNDFITTPFFIVNDEISVFITVEAIDLYPEDANRFKLLTTPTPVVPDHNKPLETFEPIKCPVAEETSIFDRKRTIVNHIIALTQQAREINIITDELLLELEALDLEILQQEEEREDN